MIIEIYEIMKKQLIVWVMQFNDILWGMILMEQII